MLDSVTQERLLNSRNPGMGNRVTGIHKFLVDFKYLWLEQLYGVRVNWQFYLLFSILLPFIMVFGLGRIGRVETNPASLLFIISGTAIFTGATEGIANMSQRIGVLKKEGRLIYYASLPINKVAFILALLFARLAVNFLGMLIPLLVGPVIYNLQIDLNLWVLLLLPFTALSLSAVGVALGSIISSYELILVLSNFLLVILLLASPIFTPVANLPLPLQIVGYLLPTTYAAEALRHSLSGAIDSVFYFNLGMLVFITFTSLYVVNRFLRWRLD